MKIRSLWKTMIQESRFSTFILGVFVVWCERFRVKTAPYMRFEFLASRKPHNKNTKQYYAVRFRVDGLNDLHTV